MKKIFLAFLAGIIICLFFAFKNNLNYEVRKNTAEVDQFEGYYIFVDARPISEYDYLGTVKSSISLGDAQYVGVRDRLIRKAKKDFPEANGLILTFKTGGADKCDAIKLK